MLTVGYFSSWKTKRLATQIYKIFIIRSFTANNNDIKIVRRPNAFLSACNVRFLFN